MKVLGVPPVNPIFSAAGSDNGTEANRERNNPRNYKTAADYISGDQPQADTVVHLSETPSAEISHDPYAGLEVTHPVGLELEALRRKYIERQIATGQPVPFVKG